MPKPMSSLSASLAKRADATRRSIRIEGDRMREAMRAHAVELTSGPPGPATPGLLPIGRRTGRLQNSLRIIRTGDNSWRLQFTARHAPFVVGPKARVDRGFWREMSRRARREMRRRNRT